MIYTAHAELVEARQEQRAAEEQVIENNFSSRDIESLIEQGRRNAVEGNFAGARDKLQKAASLGSVEAHIELADLEYRDGSPARAQLELDKVEVLAQKLNDAHAFVALSGAYQLMMGSGEPSEQQRLALTYLRRAAELGLISAQATLAHWHRFGLNGAKADLTLFRYWVELAADGGDPLAICDQVDDLIKQRNFVPPDLKNKIRSLASEYTEARRLLKKL